MKNAMMKECKAMILNACNDGRLDGLYACDVHNEIFNTDYFKVYTHDAVEWMGSDAWACIEAVQDYENNNFGEVSTDLSDPCKVVNMFCYIVGEEAISEINTLSDKWNDTIDSDDVKKIIEELES